MFSHHIISQAVRLLILQILAEDAEAGAEDEKEVEELKKQGINPLPKPPPGVGLLPTPPRPGPTDSSTPLDFGAPGPQHSTIPSDSSSCPGITPVPSHEGPPPPCPEGGSFQPAPNHGLSPPATGPPPPCGGNPGKKIPSLFEIVVKPTGQLAQKLGVRLHIFFLLTAVHL